MPQLILRQSREKWTEWAAQAMQASVDPILLEHILQVGFWPFASLAQATFRSAEPGIVFTIAELRAMFRYLEQHRASPEVLKQCILNAQYQREYYPASDDD